MQLAPRRATVRRFALAAALPALWLLPAGGAVAEPLLLSGQLRLQASSFEADRSWLQGGAGKLTGGEGRDQGASEATAEARLGLDWDPSLVWNVHLTLAGAVEDVEARSAGLLEAFARAAWAVGEGHEWTVKAGQFFLGTSRENVDPLWTSPYTLTLSAWNSWIAEEVRPTGLEIGYTRITAAEHRLSLAATAFGGNDGSGVLLAWRGFAFHDRPTVAGAFLPLPELDALAGIFSSQSRRGTRPIGDDLDDRVGVAGRARFRAVDDRFLVQVAAWDNRGDRLLHGDQYAWRTRFGQLAAEAELPAGFRLISEVALGDTSMGPSGEALGKPFNVFADFEAGYLLLTWSRGGWRVSARHDRFEVGERDRSPRAEDNGEQGQAWALAVLWQSPQHWRLGVEALAVDGERDGLPGGHVRGSTDGRSLSAEVRYRF